jgi:hypothetical protein
MPNLSSLFGGSEPMPNLDRPIIVDPVVPTRNPINGQPTPAPVIDDPAVPDDIIDPTAEPGAEPISGNSGGSGKGQPSADDPTDGPVEEDIPDRDEEPVTEAPIADPNCPPGYKPVIIYVPDDMPTSELPALPVGPDGHVTPPAQGEPQGPNIIVPPDGIAEPEKPDQDPLKPDKPAPGYWPGSGFWADPGRNPNILPWVNPDLYNHEANPYIGIVPSDQEIPGSIGHVDLPENAIVVPDESKGWWHSAVEKFQNIPLVEKIQDYINEKRASLAVDGVEVSDPSLQQDGMGITD